jgi:hypothetical protein
MKDFRLGGREVQRSKQVREHAIAFPLGAEHQVPELLAWIHHADRGS